MSNLFWLKNWQINAQKKSELVCLQKFLTNFVLKILFLEDFKKFQQPQIENCKECGW